MNSKLIVALDVGDLNSVLELVNKLYPTVKIFKVGSQLFTSCGPGVIEMVNEKGAKVFLDLKFHDIPNTVAGAVRAAARLGVFMLNVHIQGGLEMMKGAKQAALEESRKAALEKPIVLGVTVLTSMGQKDLMDIEIRRGMKSQVTHLARLAKQAGLDGVVASPKEIQPIKWTCGDDFLVVSPGIRPEWAESFDQRRVATPKQAVSQGADFIVVGRPITKAEDPLSAAKRILDELKE